jgi:hypothetical protein
MMFIKSAITISVAISTVILIVFYVMMYFMGGSRDCTISTMNFPA